MFANKFSLPTADPSTPMQPDQQEGLGRKRVRFSLPTESPSLGASTRNPPQSAVITMKFDPSLRLVTARGCSLESLADVQNSKSSTTATVQLYGQVKDIPVLTSQKYEILLHADPGRTECRVIFYRMTDSEDVHVGEWYRFIGRVLPDYSFACFSFSKMSCHLEYVCSQLEANLVKEV